jgi:hypothetical protein
MRSLKILFLFIFTLSHYSDAQNTVVEGYVFEDSTTIPLTYAKVFFLGTQVGATTDTAGYFKISIPEKAIKHDSIMVSYLGYISQQLPIQRGVEQNITIRLHSTLFAEYDEVVIVAGENPAWPYMRKLIANKDNNNPENLDMYTVDEYAKIRFDLNNFTDKIKKNILLRPFDYIWDNTKETENGVSYLPVLITEKLSEHYYKQSPKDRKEIVQGEKTTGIAGPNLVEFTNDLYVTPNIYENFVTILGKSFPSPLNDNYKMNYKFYLMDSTYSEEGVTYKIRFKPKYQRELAFVGEMYFDSASYAIKEINLRFDVQANVNFVRSYYITQIYDKVDGEHWMLTESRVLGDFTVMENASDLAGFFGRKKALYTNYTINKKIDNAVFKGVDPVEYTDNALVRDEAFWVEQRTENLSDEEKTLYAVTKRVENDPAFKIRKNLILTFGTGYIPMNGIQLGNIYSFYSYNAVEKSRFKFGLRTNPNNSFPLHFSVFGAYGTYDKQWKYGLSSFLDLTKKGITRIGGSYSYDIDQIGRSFNQIALDHVMSSLIQIGNTASRNYVTNFEGYFEKSFTTGFLGRIGYFYTDYSPTGTDNYLRVDDNGNPSTVSRYRTSGIRATVKFSHLYKEITGAFYDKKERKRGIQKYPDLAIQYDYADQKLFGSDYDFQKIKLSIRQKVNARKLGYFNYAIEGGTTLGTVPHVSLDVPFGDQLVLADAQAFNLMQFMEFAADQYVSVHLSHHFGGLLLDRIPLVNKLKWRSLIFGKAFFGSLSDANNQQTYLFPYELRGIQEPYYEVGFGLENIFKIARMDFVWRLTPGQEDYYWFMVKPSFVFSF